MWCLGNVYDWLMMMMMYEYAVFLQLALFN